MSGQHRDDGGRFDEKMTDQDILKAFDYETTDDDPFLTAREVTDALADHFEIDVTVEAVRLRLESMHEADTVAKRRFGSSVAYRTLVAPRLAPEVEDAAESVAHELDDGETVSHEDLLAELNSE